MPFEPMPHPWSVLASTLAAVTIVLTVASCSNLTPLGPDPAATMPPIRHLGSPIILQEMLTQPPAPAGGCPAGYVAISGPAVANQCYRKIGAPVTITSAGVSPVTEFPNRTPSGQAAYGVTVAVPAADVAAVTAILRQAYVSQGAVTTSVAGTTWAAPQVWEPFPGRQLQIALNSRNQALQLYRMLVPSG